MIDPLTPQPASRPLRWPDYLTTLQSILGTDAEGVFLVGGVVRDAFWGIPAHDIDLAVARNAFKVARKIANTLDGAFYKLDPERETGRAIVTLHDQRLVIDVASFRGTSLLDDLTGRDFTLNAVAAPLSGDLNTVIDPLNGLQDAQNRILRRCSPISIESDPIRALRAVRLALRFNLRIEPETRHDIHQHVNQLAQASPERIRDEFIALLGGKRPATGLRTLDTLGLLPTIIPEVDSMRGVEQSPPHHADVWSHTLQVVNQLDGILRTINPKRSDNTAAQAGRGMIVYYLDRYRANLQTHLASAWPNERTHAALLILAALLHDAGKPETAREEHGRIRFIGHEQAGAILAETRATELRLSRHETERIATIIKHHMRPHTLASEPHISRRAIYRFWRDTGPAGVDICLLALADYLAVAGTNLNIEQWSHYLEQIGTLMDGYFAENDQNVTQMPVLITGKDLTSRLKLTPGPVIGQLLEQVREAQAAGEITTRDEALDLARDLASQM